jgi:membrane protein YdbS with pleckstrin-like domain
MRPPPREYLDPRARTLWRLTGLLQAIPVVLAGLAAGFVLTRFELVPTPIAVLLAGTLILIAALGVWPYPDLLWRHWRYEIGEAEVDLQHGWLSVTRTLIPMARIQHVDTRRGPLQRRFGLASVVLYTAAGASEIPALADGVADAARDRIAALANVSDDL